MTKSIDKTSREDIVRDIKKSFFVEAGAGSGKTTMLVNRMVAMVESGIDISQICAITFTKAAATEFYSRFQQLLIDRSIVKPNSNNLSDILGEPTEETMERCKKALQDFERCFMGTIDSFCNMLVREHPNEAKVPADVRLIDESQLKQLIKREYRKISEDEYRLGNPELLKRFQDISGYKAEERFAAIAYSLMEKRNTEFVLPDVPEDLETYLAKEKAAVVEIVDALCKNPSARWETPKDSREAWEELDENASLISADWNDGTFYKIKNLVKKLGKISINPEFDLFLLGPKVADLFEDNIHGRTKKLSRYDIKKTAFGHITTALDEYEYAITTNFVSQCVEEISTKLRNEGLLTYFDYKLYVRDMLKNDAAGDCELIKHIAERHSYFLLDETQDTDPMQYEIFFYLSADTPKENLKDCKPREGALFIVGDPKQSIYRFKGANITSYLEVKNMFSGGDSDKRSLTKNFRSNNDLKEWFNDVFSGLMPADSDDQSKYEPIPIDAAEKDFTSSFRGVYKYFSGGTDKKNTSDESDFCVLAKIICDLVHQSKVQIRVWDEEKKDFIMRPVEFGDIMVITKMKKDIPSYIQEFTNKRIPYRVEGELAFYDCPALNDVIKCFKSIAMPRDNRQLYSALKSNVFGITNEQILDLKTHGLNIGIFHDIPENTEKTIDRTLADALKRMKEAYLKSLNMTSAALFSMIVEEFNVLEKCGVDNLEYLYYVLELLRKAEQSGAVTTLPEAAVFLEKLISGNNKTERSISFRRNQNSVHIANLHKVKGLEAPIVILGAAEETSFPPDIRTEYIGSDSKSWFFKFKDGDNYGQLFTKAFLDKEKDEEISAYEEFIRLMYVAATRAKNALIVGCISDSSTNYWQHLIDNCHNNLYDAISDKTPYTPAVVTEKIADLYAQGGNIDLADTSDEKKQTYKVVLPSKEEKVLSKAEEESSLSDEAVETKPSRGTYKGDPRIIGTMVHRFMEVIVSSRGKVNPDLLIDELIENYKDKLTIGVNYKEILSEMSNTIMAGGYSEQEPGVTVDILDELLNADEVHCELPFCYKEENRPGEDYAFNGEEKVPLIWRGTMDVVYKKEGSWYILDYKTNYENNNLSHEYKKQLNSYVKAFKVLTGEDADANVYSIPV